MKKFIHIAAAVLRYIIKLAVLLGLLYLLWLAEWIKYYLSLPE